MKLTLYHFQSCTYCKRVREYLKNHGISVEMKDIHENPSFKRELLGLGGKTQVPCLAINGKTLYESMSIIEWFKKNYKK